MNRTAASPSPVDGAEQDEDNGDLHRIGDVARLFDVSLRTLRFYEDKGLIEPTRRGTTRLYGKRDVARIKLVLFGTKVGFSLREIKQMMDLYDPDGTNPKQLRVVLEKSERQLARLEKRRREIDEAIEELSDAAMKIRGTLETRQMANAA